MLQVRDLRIEIGSRVTLEGASFKLRPGDKVGLVGRNGTGKTTMLKVIAGEAPPPAGWCCAPRRSGTCPRTRRPGARASTTPASPMSCPAAASTPPPNGSRSCGCASRSLPSDKDVAKFARAEEQFRDAGGYAAESEVRRIAAGLGLTDGRLDLPIDALSGGERRRVELARILFAGSELLLLDEPTNHLDNDAKEWLVGFLRQYRGALLVVSHDLELLDSSITRVLHLNEGELVEYRGTYSQYLAAHAADEERLARLATRQGAEIDRLRHLADTMRGQSSKRAKTAKSLDTRVSKLQTSQVTGPRGEAHRGALPGPAAAGQRRPHRRRPDQGLRRPAGLH